MLAEVAQLAERRYRKPQVVGSIPTLGSGGQSDRNCMKRKFVNFEERKNKRNAAVFMFLTIAAIVALYFLGIPALGKLTSFVSSLRGNNQKIGSSDITPPPPPKFRNFPEFTNQQNLTLNGNTEAGASVKLTFNGNPQEVLADASGLFSFNVMLQDGINTFAAIAVDQSGNQSQKSDDYEITFDKKVPELEITSPTDGSSYFGSNQRQVTIEGKTEAESSVTINDRIISVDDEGIFQYTTTLNEGANAFNIKSTDRAGNIIEKSLNLNFTP